MKVKELIQELSKFNQDAPVMVNGEPVHYVQGLPAYYDGCTVELIEDSKLKPYYAVVGFKYSNTIKAGKCCIETVSIEDHVSEMESIEDLDSIKLEFDHTFSKEKIKEKKDKIYNHFLNNQLLFQKHPALVENILKNNIKFEYINENCFIFEKDGNRLILNKVKQDFLVSGNTITKLKELDEALSFIKDVFIDESKTWSFSMLDNLRNSDIGGKKKNKKNKRK